MNPNWLIAGLLIGAGVKNRLDQANTAGWSYPEMARNAYDTLTQPVRTRIRERRVRAYRTFLASLPVTKGGER